MVSPPQMVTYIRLFGYFEVQRGERVLPAREWPRRKAAALLQRLALEKRLLKDQAIDFLWPESDIESGANNLYRSLYTLRQVLNKHLGADSAEALFAYEDGVFQLLEPVWVDVHEFQKIATAPAQESRQHQVARLESALELYRGDLLPDELYAEWTIQPREELHRSWRNLCRQLAAVRREDGNFTAAIDLIADLLKTDPLDEPLQRELIRTYALAGRRHDALRQYQALAGALNAELDLPPEPETSALYTQILKGDLAPTPAPASSSWRPPPPVQVQMHPGAILVGRNAELERLTHQIQLASQGRGQTILIAGDSGMGKTRLAFEALSTAASQGMQTLMGAAYEQEGSLPYQPYIEAFDHHLAENLRPLAENPISGFQYSRSGDLQQEQWALFNATARFVAQLAEKAPVVFLIDDLHAADETSLHLFHYLARQTRSSATTILATYRSDALTAASPAFNGLINSLYREGLSETIHLKALPLEAVAEVMRNLLGGDVDEQMVQAVYASASGNPFFIQEITRTLDTSSEIELRAGTWSLRPGVSLRVPPSLSALLREQVARLGTGVEAILSAAAVIGSEFNFDLLLGVTSAIDAEILDALDAAFASHLLDETPGGYQFHHPLIRRTLYETLGRTRRARMHARAAETIEVLHARQPGGLVSLAETLAYHYDLSDRRERALEYLIQAGEKAASVYAFELAIDTFERALSLMDSLGFADPAQRWMLLESLGRWGSILADTPRAVERFEQALALPRGDGWAPKRNDLVRLHCYAAVTLITAGDTRAAEAHLATAMQEVDEQANAPEFADLLYNLAQLRWHQNEYQQSFEAAERSLAIAQRLDDQPAIARAFEMLALACHSLGEWQAGMAYEEQRALHSGPWLDVTDAFDVHL